jgi:hypothetical protein
MKIIPPYLIMSFSFIILVALYFLIATPLKRREAVHKYSKESANQRIVGMSIYIVFMTASFLLFIFETYTLYEKFRYQ